MKRTVAILVSLGLLLVIGCAQNYDIRLGKTIENMKYDARLNKNLEPAPTKSNLETSQVYLRPPKGLQGPTQTPGLVVEPGRFDIQDTFIDQSKQGSLHVLARVDRPKAPSKKGTSPAEATPRGDFTADVLDLLKNTYGTDFDTSRLKAETKSHGGRSNSFKSLTLDLTAKEVKVYLFGDKNSREKVALIFDYPKEQYKGLVSKIDLCLESFRVGDDARRAFSGIGEDELGEEGGGSQAPAVF